MKVLNRLGSLNLYFRSRKVYLGFGIVALLTISMILAPVLAGIITVSGNCTGTTNISNTNYVFTGSCTGTISTSETTTTTSTTMNPEIIYHVNGGPNCPVLGIVADVNSFRGNFSVTNANGLSMWKINFNMSDLADNLLAVLTFSAINESYTISQIVYQHGSIIQNTTIPVDYHGPLLNGMDIDFYTDGDGGQFFLYAPMQSSILFGHNFPNFLQGPGVPFVAFNDIATNIAPVHSDGQLTFSHLNLNQQEGQQFEQPQPPANIPIFVVNPMVTPDPCSLQPATPGPNINAIQNVIGPKNNQTLIELEMKSP